MRRLAQYQNSLIMPKKGILDGEPVRGSGPNGIFSCTPFPPNYGGLAFSGCGHLNPIQNDPELRFIGVGTNLLFNGNEGYVFSTGTRCSSKYPNLMTVADMKGMYPSLMGGFLTAAGVENLASYALAIPILDDSMLKPIMTRDDEIPLSVGDIWDRHKIGQADYGQAWSGDEVISAKGEPCIKCDECKASAICPLAQLYGGYRQQE